MIIHIAIVNRKKARVCKLKQEISLKTIMGAVSDDDLLKIGTCSKK